jgi:hypothetical protein
MTDTTAIPADETPVDELLTPAEWDALGRAVVPGWDAASPTAKKIWRGFARDLATGYRHGLAAGRAAAGEAASLRLSLAEIAKFADAWAADGGRASTHRADLSVIADTARSAARVAKDRPSTTVPPDGRQRVPYVFNLDESTGEVSYRAWGANHADD